MQLLPTRVRQLEEVIERSPLDRRDFRFEMADGAPILRFSGRPTEIWFRIKGSEGAYQVSFVPGERDWYEERHIRYWAGVLQHVGLWLENTRRELDAAERLGSSPSGKMPDWCLAELPPEYADTVRQIATLQENERRLRRMAGLLWETGDPLTRLVRDLFRELGFSAESTIPGATYDITATVPGGRLLLEVTGIDGQINKASKKIAQVLQAQQHDAAPDDRVIIVVNAHRERPLAERDKLDPVTPDALRLLQGMEVVVVTTADLFRVWRSSRTDIEGARREIERIRTAPAAVLRLGVGAAT